MRRCSFVSICFCPVERRAQPRKRYPASGADKPVVANLLLHPAIFNRHLRLFNRARSTKSQKTGETTHQKIIPPVMTLRETPFQQLATKHRELYSPLHYFLRLNLMFLCKPSRFFVLHFLEKV